MSKIITKPYLRCRACPHHLKLWFYRLHSVLIFIDMCYWYFIKRSDCISLICNTYIIYRANSWLWQNMCTNSSQKAMNQTFWFCLVNGILTQVNVYTFWKTLVSLFYSEIICRTSNLLQLLVQTDKLKTNVIVETSSPHHTHTHTL